MRPSWPPPRMPSVTPGEALGAGWGIMTGPLMRGDGLLGHGRGLPRPPCLEPPASVASDSARMAAASSAALMAPALPMASVPTGMPAGIWTIDSRLSTPRSAVALHRHAQHRQRGQRRRHARQVGRAAGAGDDHLEAAVLGALGVGIEPLGRAVGRNDAGLVRHAERIQRLGGVPHGVPVGLAAHDDGNGRRGHVGSFLENPHRKSGNL